MKFTVEEDSGKTSLQQVSISGHVLFSAPAQAEAQRKERAGIRSEGRHNTAVGEILSQHFSWSHMLSYSPEVKKGKLPKLVHVVITGNPNTRSKSLVI